MRRSVYQVSWGFSLLWLGISIILSYFTGYNILGLFLIGIGLYGLVVSVKLHRSEGDRAYIIYSISSLAILFFGFSIMLHLIFQWVLVLGILLIITGLGILLYYM